MVSFIIRNKVIVLNTLNLSSSASISLPFFCHHLVCCTYYLIELWNIGITRSLTFIKHFKLFIKLSGAVDKLQLAFTEIWGGLVFHRCFSKSIKQLKLFHSRTIFLVQKLRRPKQDMKESIKLELFELKLSRLNLQLCLTTTWNLR